MSNIDNMQKIQKETEKWREKQKNKKKRSKKKRTKSIYIKETKIKIQRERYHFIWYHIIAMYSGEYLQIRRTSTLSTITKPSISYKKVLEGSFYTPDWFPSTIMNKKRMIHTNQRMKKKSVNDKKLIYLYWDIYPSIQSVNLTCCRQTLSFIFFFLFFLFRFLFSFCVTSFRFLFQVFATEYSLLISAAPTSQCCS